MVLIRRPPRLCKAPIRRNEPLQHRHDQPLRIGRGLAALPGQRLGIGDQIAVQACGR